MSQKLLRIEFDALCFRAEALHAGGGSARIFFLGGINRVCHAFWALAQLSDGSWWQQQANVIVTLAACVEG